MLIFASADLDNTLLKWAERAKIKIKRIAYALAFPAEYTSLPHEYSQSDIA